MKCTDHLFVLANCFFWIIRCHAKYLISANDSVSLHSCDLESMKNISQLNANPEEIVIQNCHIEKLPNALFIRFHRLRILEITESQLETVSDFAFNGLSSLQLLNLSRNNLTTFKTWSNGDLKALHLLDLRRNAIESIHTNALERYPNLLKLNLAVNHIREIPDELFRFTPALKSLNLGKNNLKSIDSLTLKHLHKLIHLEMKHNQIEFIDAGTFIGCTHLKVLHLQVCCINVKNRYKASVDCWNLIKLDKYSQDNQITSFHQDLISNLPRLHSLNLSHNLLDDFSDDTFAKNEELLSLDVSFNYFVEFTEFTFKGLEVLEVCVGSNLILCGATQYLLVNEVYAELFIIHALVKFCGVWCVGAGSLISNLNVFLTLI